MAEVIFFEKPGCINNARQKKLLRQAGHNVVCQDLLQYPWSEEKLMSFFRELPIADWFNSSAPAVKSGDVIPERLDADTALRLMLDDPILIRRPLMQYDNQTMVGFDYLQVKDWIGLEQDLSATDLEQCLKK